eukprot:s127_g23.t2
MRKAAREEDDEAEDPDKFMRQEEDSGSEGGKKRKGRGKGKGRGRGRGRQPKPPAEIDEKTSGDRSAVEADAPKRKKTKTTDSTVKNLDPEFEAVKADGDDEIKKGKLGKTKDNSKEKKPTKGHVAEGEEGGNEKEQKVEEIDEDGMEGPKEDEERKDKKKPEKTPEAKAPGKRTHRKVVTPKKKRSTKASEIPEKTREKANAQHGLSIGWVKYGGVGQALHCADYVAEQAENRSKPNPLRAALYESGLELGPDKVYKAHPE